MPNSCTVSELGPLGKPTSPFLGSPITAGIAVAVGRVQLGDPRLPARHRAILRRLYRHQHRLVAKALAGIPDPALFTIDQQLQVGK